MSAIHRLQNILLKASIRRLKLQNSFQKILDYAFNQNRPNYYPRSKSKSKQVTSLSYIPKNDQNNSVQISQLLNNIKNININNNNQSLICKNKILYLQYVQDVLMKKQQQLLQFQKQLQNTRKFWNEKDYQQSIGKPLTQISQIQVIQRKLQTIRQECLIPLLKMKILYPNNHTNININNNNNNNHKTKSSNSNSDFGGSSKFTKQSKQTQNHTNIPSQLNQAVQQQNQRLKQIYANFQKKQQQILQQIQWKRQLSDQMLRQQYDRIQQQKREFIKKMTQFQQLTSYQKYLNQMQQVLQQKEIQLVERQKQLNQIQQRLNRSQQNNQSIEQGSFSTNQRSHKKRARIFQNKKIASSSPARVYMKNNETFAINQSIQSTIKEQSSIKYQQNQNYYQQQNTIQNKNQNISQDSSLRFTNSPYSNKKSHTHITSHSKNDKDKDNRDRQLNSNLNKKSEHNNNISQYLSLNKSNQEYQLRDCSIQVDDQSALQCIDRLRKQKLIIKYLALWTKVSSNKQKDNIQHKKIMFLNRWKINSNYDETVPQKFVQILTGMDINWFKKCKQLKAQKLFPYKQLSIQRRRYLQLLFDHERRIFHHRKLVTSLQNIIRNKNLKERAATFIYFQKFHKNARFQTCKLLLQQQIQASNKNDFALSSNQNYYNGESQITSKVLSRNSSKILNEPHIQKITHGYFEKGDKKSTNQTNLSITKQEQKEFQLMKKESISNLAKNLKKPNQQSHPHLSPSSGKKGGNKQNFNATQTYHNKSISNNSNHSRSISRSNLKNSQIFHNKSIQTANIDVKKLKQYIKEKELTQRVLAKKYLQTQGTFKMMSVLIPKTNQFYNNFFNYVKYSDDQKRMAQIQKKVNCYDFKWELFMTKCKLGLTNNSTKIGHLEQLLGFSLFQK